MKNKLAIVIILTLGLAVGVTARAYSGQSTERGVGTRSPGAAGLQAGRFYALVIGDNDYVYLPKLRTAIKDAEAVAELLRTTYGFEVRLLRNATRTEVIRAINEYRRTLDASANLLIYYAGHGNYDQDADKAYWLPTDAEERDNANWISADDVTSNIRAIPARHILVVSDSCYSGMMQRGSKAGILPSERSKYLQKMAEGKSRLILSSGGNEPVMDGGGGGHSVFASAFIKGLLQADEDVFTAEELYYNFIREAVTGRSEQTPQYSTIRNSGHESGDFVFWRSRAGSAGREPASAGVAAGSPDLPAGTKPVDPGVIELRFWETIKDSKDPADFKAYLQQYPNGKFAALARLRAFPEPRTDPRPASRPARSEADEAAAYKSWYDAYSAKDLAHELERGQAYVESFPRAKNADYVKKDIVRVRVLLLNQSVQRKNLAELTRLGREAMDADPDNLDYPLVLAGQLRALDTGSQYAADTGHFARTAIRLIEAGKTPTASSQPFLKNETLAYLYDTLAAIEEQGKNQDAALEFSEHAGSLDPMNARYFFNCGRLHQGRYAVAADDFRRFPEADRSGSMLKPEVKAALDKVNFEADGLINCWARFVALPKNDYPADVKQKVQTALTDLYRYRHNNSTDGLQKLIDDNRDSRTPVKRSQ